MLCTILYYTILYYIILYFTILGVCKQAGGGGVGKAGGGRQGAFHVPILLPRVRPSERLGSTNSDTGRRVHPGLGRGGLRPF